MGVNHAAIGPAASRNRRASIRSFGFILGASGSSSFVTEGAVGISSTPTPLASRAIASSSSSTSSSSSFDILPLSISLISYTVASVQPSPIVSSVSLPADMPSPLRSHSISSPLSRVRPSPCGSLLELSFLVVAQIRHPSVPARTRHRS